MNILRWMFSITSGRSGTLPRPDFQSLCFDLQFLGLMTGFHQQVQRRNDSSTPSVLEKDACDGPLSNEQDLLNESELVLPPREPFLTSPCGQNLLNTLYFGGIAVTMVADQVQQHSSFKQLPTSLKETINVTGNYSYGIAAIIVAKLSVPNLYKSKLGIGAAVAASTYIALGESLLPQIWPGYADVRDIPAAIIGVGVGYFFFKAKSLKENSNSEIKT